MAATRCYRVGGEKEFSDQRPWEVREGFKMGLLVAKVFGVHNVGARGKLPVRSGRQT